MEDFNRELLGVSTKEEDWKTCVKASGFNDEDGDLRAVAGSMYVRKYSYAETKETTNEIRLKVNKYSMLHKKNDCIIHSWNWYNGCA